MNCCGYPCVVLNVRCPNTRCRRLGPIADWVVVNCPLIFEEGREELPSRSDLPTGTSEVERLHSHRFTTKAVSPEDRAQSEPVEYVFPRAFKSCTRELITRLPRIDFRSRSREPLDPVVHPSGVLLRVSASHPAKAIAPNGVSDEETSSSFLPVPANTHFDNLL
jgi:hypothetical protein